MGRTETDNKAWPWDSKTPTKVGTQWVCKEEGVGNKLLELRADGRFYFFMVKGDIVDSSTDDCLWLPIHIGELPKPEIDCSVDELIDIIEEDDYLLRLLTISDINASKAVDRVVTILNSHRIKEEATDGDT